MQNMPILDALAAVYVATPEYLHELCHELGEGLMIREHLVFSTLKRPVCFAKDVWFEPVIQSFHSISEAVKILKGVHKYWYSYPISHIRRSKLIEEQLFKQPSCVRPFPVDPPLPPMGVFGLLDEHTLIYSTSRLKTWPNGVCQFIEDKFNPPSRAYLKLWEALSLLNKYPDTGDHVLDLGAAPGGWTYVMQSLGASVTAVDKAPLVPSLMRSSQVHYVQQSAFAIEPDAWGKTYDWVLSDVICYPKRAYQLIRKWIASGRAKQLIVTIKLQGNTDWDVLNQLKNIPDARLLQLHHNKHELTFFYPASF